MTALTVPVPEFLLSSLRLSPAEVVKEMVLVSAIHWYQQGVLSQERAAELAGMNRRDFICTLAHRKVEVFTVDMNSLARELEAVSGEK